MITQQGWEEIRRVAVLEWIQEPASPGPDSVRNSIDLNARAGVYALARPMIVRRGSRWILRLKSASRPLAPYDHTVELALGAPGSVVLVRDP